MTKLKTESTTLERLKSLINDRDETAGLVDEIEDELSTARAEVRTARDLSEADSMIARVTDLENQLAKAEARAQLAAEIVQRDARGLQEAALRELRADIVRRYGPEAARLDRAVVDNVTALFELFAKRRELETTCSAAMLEIPSTGLGTISRDCGIVERSCAIAHFSLQLAGIERHFAPIE